MTVKQGIDEIRRIITKIRCTEKELYEALLSEADGWKMRLEEVADEEDGSRTR